jgi:D-alanyl-D-alanine dipeptidase
VQTALESQGLGLKIWDAYRPLSAQKALWAIKPDKRFVALPSKGSKHNRGAAVDLTLVDSKGKEKPMPCDFDTFSPRAGPKFSGGTAEQRRNRDILRRAMLEAGFLPDKNEWWHFNDSEWKRYPLVNVPLVVSGRDKSE